MLGQDLRRLVETHGARPTAVFLSEALNRGLDGITPQSLPIPEVARAFGMDRFLPGYSGPRFQMPLMEAGEGIDVSAFAHITGQIFYNMIADGWERAERVGEMITHNYPTKLDAGEKIPWIGHATDLGEEVLPGMPFTETAFGERFVTMPRLQKQGKILSLTKESIFFDHTGQIMKGAEELGENLAYTKERMIMAVVFGLTNTYLLNNISGQTYQVTGSPQTSPNIYINSQSGVPFTDWTSINTYYTLSPAILDPDSQLPLVMKPKILFVMPPRITQANRVISGRENRTTYPGYGAASPASPGNNQLISEGNALPDPLKVVSSSIAYQLLQNPQLAPGVPASVAGVTFDVAQDSWLIGDLQRSFYWLENWPLQIQQAPVGNIREFEQDIMMRYKASFRGQCGVFDPRYSFYFHP